MPLPRCARIDANDEQSRSALLAEGWREIEILETWDRSPADLEPAIKVIHAEETHREKLRELFMNNMGPNRLARDGYPEPAAQIRAGLIDRAHLDNILTLPNVSGACLVQPEGIQLRIVLIASSVRGQGVGTALVRAVLKAAHRKFDYVVAGTQHDNYPARKLYEANGFKVIRRMRTFHKDVE